MTDPRENRIAESVREELRQLRRDLAEFDEQMVDAGLEPGVRERLRHWWDERLGVRIIERGERRMKGLNGG